MRAIWPFSSAAVASRDHDEVTYVQRSDYIAAAKRMHSYLCMLS